MVMSRKANVHILYDAHSLCDADGPPQICAEWFTAAYWRELHAIVGEAPGRGASIFIDATASGSASPNQQWTLRPYRRGGLIEHLSEDRYLWTGADQSRAFREFRLTARLHDQGLPVPQPVGACVWRQGIFYQAALMTVRIPGARALADLLANGSASDELLADVGRLIHRFHAAGLDHVDLNARNILVDAQSEPWLIDFDRCRLRAQGQWRQRNLDRLKRSIDKFAPQRANDYSKYLLQGYAAS